jgi:hypothetical protein
VTISDNLKHDLTTNMDAEWIFQKHVVDGPSFFFKNYHSEPNDEYHLRHEIAKITDTSINDVIIIGSAKLGFSVKTDNFLKFDHEYESTKNVRDRSDIDIALVNSKYFERIAEEIYHLSGHFDPDWISNNWQINPYCREKNDLFTKYSRYVTRGWLRPDYMPNVYLNNLDWKKTKSAWANKLDRKLAIGVYSNWTYLKHYHMDNLEKLKAKFATQGNL